MIAKHKEDDFKLSQMCPDELDQTVVLGVTNVSK